jgi:hypothetical protein
MDAYTDDRAPRRARRETKGTGLPNAVREQQHDIFGAPPGDGRVGPVARSTDPSTSHDAAKKAVRGFTVKLLAVLDCMQRSAKMPRTHDGIISSYSWLFSQSGDKGVTWYPSMTDSSIRTRVSELVTLGYATKFDETGQSATGGRASRWTLTDAGRTFDVSAKLHEVVHRNARKLRNPDGVPRDGAR